MSYPTWSEPSLMQRLDWLGGEIALKREDAAKIKNATSEVSQVATEAIARAMVLLTAAIVALGRARRDLEEQS